MDKFLETIAEPLADLMRSAANWLDSHPPHDEPLLYDEDGELPSNQPQWVINAQGGAERVGGDDA